MRRHLKESQTLSILRSKFSSRNRTPEPPPAEPSKPRDVEALPEVNDAAGAYVYKPLKSTGELRLLKILPGHQGNQIYARIQHVPFHPPESDSSESSKEQLESLRDAVPSGWEVEETIDGRFLFSNFRTMDFSWEPPDADMLRERGLDWEKRASAIYEPDYEALSYTWGSDESKEYIYVESSEEDGSWTSLDIRPILAEALQYLRYPDRERTIWIDAICLNQEDILEKSEQVHQMWKIYKYARQTVAWLGPDSGDSSLAISRIRYIASNIVVLVDFARRCTPGAENSTLYRPESDISFTNKEWQAVDSFLGREYFSRLWIFSELANAGQRAFFVCGREQIAMKDFQAAVLAFKYRVREPYEGIFDKAVFTSTVFEDASKIPFDLTLAQLSNRKCADARDRVYGLLSVASPELRGVIPIDYISPVADVYRTLFMRICNHYRRVDLLKLSNATHGQIDGPSWIPNLAATATSLTYYSFCSGFSACDISASTADELRLGGKICCTISDTPEESPFYNPTLSDILDQWIPYKDLEGYYPTGETRWDAFIATFSGSWFKERWPGQTHLSIRSFTRLLTRRMEFPDEPEEAISKELHYAIRFWQSQKVFHTEDGYFGRGPENMQEGDVICAFLGCQELMVLRPSGNNAYSVVGTCYAHGFANAEAFLGPLPTQWKVRYGMKGEYLPQVHFYNCATKMKSIDDPRLGPLPDEWEWIPSKRTRDDPLSFQKYRNKSTGEVINSDPRMLPNALRAHGVELETITLV